MQLLTVTLPVSAGARDGVLRALRTLCGPVSSSPGCHVMRVYESCHSSLELLAIQQWEDRASLDAHVRSDDFKQLLMIMEQSRAAPDLRIYEVRAVAGLEAVEALREGTEP